MKGPSGSFARDHWHVVSDHINLHSPTGIEYHLRCDVFNPNTRRCDAYDDRPPICSNYPAYGEPLTPGHDKANAIPLICAFQADVRTVLPLVAVTHGR
jgi:Fe-S-cluster containining protein